MFAWALITAELMTLGYGRNGSGRDSCMVDACQSTATSNSYGRGNIGYRFPRRALRRTARRSNRRTSIEKRCLIKPLSFQVEVRSTQLISRCVARPLEALARQSAVLICSRHNSHRLVTAS